MIFTSRFGALAARPTFSRVAASEQEHASELQTHDAEGHYQAETSAA